MKLFTKYYYTRFNEYYIKVVGTVQVKNSFVTIVNGLSVLNLFKLSNGDLLFSYHLQSA